MQKGQCIVNDGTLIISLRCRNYISNFRQSKQYLTTHTIDHGKTTSGRRPIYNDFTHQVLAHPTDIFSLSTATSQILSSSGSSSIKVHSTNHPDFPLFQTLDNAHKLGCHHTAISTNGHVAASVGFGGEVKIWAAQDDGRWSERTKIVGAAFPIPKLSHRKRLEC